MKKLVVNLVCLGLLAMVAQADPVIEFYFSKMSCESIDPYSYTPPPEYGDGTMLTAAIGEPVWLWARTPYQTGAWNGISLYFTGEVTSGWMWGAVPKISGPGTTKRWENGSDFDPVDGDDIYLVNVTTKGIGAYWDDGYSIPEPGWGVVHYCLGSIDWGTPGYKWMSNGVHLTTRIPFMTSDVYFGFNEDGTPEYAGSGVIAHTTSDRADIYITPEPGSVVLLALAGLVLRRR